MAKDPIKRLRDQILNEKLASEDEIERLENSALEEIDQAVKFAEDSPDPDGNDALADVYAPGYYEQEPKSRGRKLPMYMAISEGISQEMEKDSSVLYMGEDVGVYGGIFGATTGLYKIDA